MWNISLVEIFYIHHDEGGLRQHTPAGGQGTPVLTLPSTQVCRAILSPTFGSRHHHPSKGGISSIKLLLESSPSSPSTGTTPTTLPPAPGRRRCHRFAAARARRRQRAADHQPASWRCQHLPSLLLQEKPVQHWKPQNHIINTIPPCDILPSATTVC